MAPVPFYPQSDLYRRHYIASSSQRGAGGEVFRGTPFQRGHGLGALLGSFFRSIIPALGRTVTPLLKTGAKAVGRHALRAGGKVLQDAMRGDNLKSSLRKRTGEELSSLVETAIKKVSTPSTSRVEETAIKKPHKVVNRSPKKKPKKKRGKTAGRRKRDIFD